MRYGWSHRGWSRGALALGLALSFGCSSKDDANADSAADDGVDDAGASTGVSGGTLGPATTGVGTGGQETGGGPGTGPGDDTGSAFIVNPDGGGVANECSVWSQDCPAGEKCMPWANDGGSSWNATRCSPISANPAQAGDNCTVEGSGVSGIDDCDIALMCWDVDPETNTGICVPFCEGSLDAPICSDPDAGCSISNDGVLILCLAYCDPLLQDCIEGSACYPEENGFFCSPDASGPDLGALGDPCEYINVCDPGGWCAAAELVPDCAGGSGCCAAFCDIADPAPDCPAGTECQVWYERGTAPPGYEDVGVCIIPSV